MAALALLASSARSQTITTVDDPEGAGGEYTSIAIGSDGCPVISYQHTAASTLKVAKCGDPACRTGNVVTTIDGPGPRVGRFTAIAVASDGRPVISYYDETAGALKVARCGNPGCTAGNVVTAVDDPVQTVGSFTSIAIGQDGLPVISYFAKTARVLKVAKCGNPDCTARNVLTTVDGHANGVGAFTSIAVGVDGLPVISYHDFTASALKVAKCGNPACTADNVLSTVDEHPANAVGYYTSVAVPPDGRPVISYADVTARVLKVARCGNAACTSGNTVTTVQSPVKTLGFTSIAIGRDGLPVVSYGDSDGGTLRVLKCGDASCAAGNVITAVDDPENHVGHYTSIAVGPDGLPVVSYGDMTAGALKVAKCDNVSCAPRR